MTTIENAIARELLGIFELPDWEARQPVRTLYVAFELFDWVDSQPMLNDIKRAIGGRTLSEHLEQMFCDFRCAQSPSAGDLRRMLPTKFGIWKMHPPGLRIYGWFSSRTAFVAVTAALEIDTKTDNSLNNKKRDYVLRFIRKSGLEHTVQRGDSLAIFST